jgi:hypothetical protein
MAENGRNVGEFALEMAEKGGREGGFEAIFSYRTNEDESPETAILSSG